MKCGFVTDVLSIDEVRIFVPLITKNNLLESNWSQKLCGFFFGDYNVIQRK